MEYYRNRTRGGDRLPLLRFARYPCMWLQIGQR